MNNESFSKKPDGHESPDLPFIPSIDGEYLGVLLKGLSNGFHATSILLCTQQGDVLFANKVAVQGFPGKSIDEVVGKNLCDLAPQDWAHERIDYIKLTIQRERPLLLFETLAGCRLSSSMSPIVLSINGKPEPAVLITVEPVTPRKLKSLKSYRDPKDIFEAKVVDLGRLAVLTPRELEVLALMGKGLRQRQIALKLHRSVSTIDRHRERIGEKLGVTDRIELVTLAREAALEVTDATRTISSFGHTRYEVD